jgi:hypothetical protein
MIIHQCVTTIPTIAKTRAYDLRPYSYPAFRRVGGFNRPEQSESAVVLRRIALSLDLTVCLEGPPI